MKQLSPLDATNLNLFKETPRYPIVQYDYRASTGTAPCKTNLFLENPDSIDINLNATSMSNLSRLGLVSISYETGLNDDELYKKYLEHPYRDSKKKC
ncbi:Abi-alpha family protein [Bacillus paramycoides]|uniref:Abi-alpha family protein n=1 Tax=Bacillus paramycoides TaxID=2026194 RepID=UPI00399CC7F3